MRVVVYSVKSFEKELLAKANRKKHDITLISNPLSPKTAVYAEGKDAVVVFTNDDVSAPVINKLADLGVRYIATRSAGTDHIDLQTAELRHIKTARVPAYSPQAIAEYAATLALALSRKLVTTVEQSRAFDFRVNPQPGFNFYGKTVGLIGLGHIGLAAAQIFRGLGCRVIAYDIQFPEDLPGIEPVDLDTLCKKSDIISLHAPLTPATHHLINGRSLAKMKDGVMIINTSRGALIDTSEIIKAIEKGKVGYFGSDVYEFEKGLFFFDHHQDVQKDELLVRLMSMPNVIITPHQAFLTSEALQEIAAQTIENLDKWQEDKCLSNGCSCAGECKYTGTTSSVH